MKSSSWVIWVGSKSKIPYKRDRRGDSIGDTDAQRRRPREDRGVRPRAKERRQPPGARRGKERCGPPEPANTSDLGLLASRAVREYIRFVLRHHACDPLFLWPLETNMEAIVRTLAFTVTGKSAKG